MISIILLAIMFEIATWRDVNMGLLGILAAALLGVGVLGITLVGLVTIALGVDQPCQHQLRRFYETAWISEHLVEDRSKPCA